MKPSSEVLEYIREALSHLYSHPMMYGLTAETVETVLSLYHDLWSIIVEQQEEYSEIRIRLHCEEVAGADTFSNNFARKFPQSTELRRAEYAISRYQRIEELLGWKVPPCEN